ncbi:Lrp/AsnC family transcriptional regulator [Chloroflexota bacterium]
MKESIDEQLARLLGENAQQNSETLAKKLNVSAATIRRRLKRLIKGGLLRIVGVIDPTKFGLPIAAVIALDVSFDKLQSVIDALAKQPEIKWVSITTGRFDIIAVARFRSTDCLPDFVKKVLAKMDGVKDSETFVCLDVRKGRYVPFT